MNKKKIIILSSVAVVIVLIVLNIKTIVMTYMGIHPPKSETIEDIYAYANKIGIEETDFYTIDSSELRELYAGSFPKVLIFKDSNLILSGNCFGLLPDLVDTLHSNNNFNVTKQNALPEELSKFKTFEGQAVNQIITAPQFTIIYYWAMWMGKLNKDKLVALEKKLKQHKNSANIRLVKVNGDFLKSWGYSDEKVTAFLENK